MKRPSAGFDAHVARVASLFIVLLALGLIACAVAGFAVTRHNDVRRAAERHAALNHALDELRPVFGDVRHLDYGALSLIGRRARLDDLRFSADPPAEAAREIQSLQDAQGRIVGWFSWAPDRALIRAMNLLWGFAGLFGVALLFCSSIVTRTSLRLARALAEARERIRKLVSEDTLTELPNQRVTLERLDDVLARSRGRKVAFARIDLDGFREINDTLGRNGGDAVLVTVAQRLRAALPDGAVIGRFKDNEFAVIAAGDDPDTAAAVVAALGNAIADPIVVEQPWHITAGIGVAQAPEDGSTSAELSRRAGLALRGAKKAGRNVTRRFEPQFETDHADRRFLQRELKSAVARQAFDVHYQPIVAANGAGTIGVEALLRWNHPTRGAIPPSAFIPLAEQDGLMGALGEIVLRRALADAMRWPGVFVAVNLSPVQVRDAHLVDVVAAAMQQAGIEPARVVLEMTEGVLIDNPEQTKARLDALRALGVSLALDDFGTGFSSLSYLQRFPFQRLKIDRAFVASLGTRGNAGAIIQSIVTLGHALGMRVLAEGIETDEQRVLLRLSGCDEMQGFLFAKPAPAEAIDRLFGVAQPDAPAAASA